MYLGILLYMGIMLYVCFVTDCQRGILLGFEFVMLTNHDKTWQKPSLIGFHWFRMVYIEVQDKKLKFGMKKMNYKMFRSIGTRSIENHISTNVKSP